MYINKKDIKLILQVIDEILWKCSWKDLEKLRDKLQKKECD